MAHSQIAGQQQKAAAGAAGSGRAPGIAAHSRGQEQDSRNAYRLSQEEEDLSLSFLGEKMDSAGPEESAYVGSMGADAVDPLMRRLQADMGSGFGSASYGTGNLHPYCTSPMPVIHPAFLLSRQSPRIRPAPCLLSPSSIPASMPPRTYFGADSHEIYFWTVFSMPSRTFVGTDARSSEPKVLT